jgi:hypothetical protein
VSTTTEQLIEEVKLHISFVRFEVFTAVTMKNAVFWDVTPCGSCKTDVSEELSASIQNTTQNTNYKNTEYKRQYFVFLRSVCRLLVTTNVVPSSPILVTLMMEAISSSETAVLTRATRRNITEGPILHIM